MGAPLRWQRFKTAAALLLVAMSAWASIGWARAEVASLRESVRAEARAEVAGVRAALEVQAKALEMQAARIVNFEGELTVLSQGFEESVEQRAQAQKSVVEQHKPWGAMQKLHSAVLRGHLQGPKTGHVTASIAGEGLPGQVAQRSLFERGSDAKASTGGRVLRSADNFVLTPMMAAVMGGDTRTVEALLRSNATLASDKDAVGWTPMMYAAVNNHTQIVEALLRSNPALASDKDLIGLTPMMKAAFAGRTHIVETLLDSNPALGFDKDVHGETVMSLAAKPGHNGAFEALLRSNFNLTDYRNNAGETAFAMAVEGRDGDKGVIKLPDTKRAVQWTATCFYISKLKGFADGALTVDDQDKKAILLKVIQMMLSAGLEATQTTVVPYKVRRDGTWSELKVTKPACYNATEILDSKALYPEELRIMIGHELLVDAIFRQHSTCNNLRHAGTGHSDIWVTKLIDDSFGAMLGKFMASFGNKILKHSEEGKTLLMGAAENGPQIISYSDPESPYICRSDLTAFDVILHWTHMYGAPPDQTTDDGYSAAMLAELAGNDQNTVKRLLLASFSLDPSSDNLIYRMAFSPITTGLMICVSFVSLATLAVVLRSRPSSNVAVVLHSRPSSKVINFILRAMALFICNHVMLYGQDVAWIFWKDKDHMSWQSLQHGLSILGQPWNFTLGCWFVPIAVMAVLSMCFMVHDLCQASNAIENCSGKDADEDVEPSDIYQNPECPMVDCLHRFLLAAVFMVVYVTKVLTPLETTLQSRTFWGLSLFVQMHLHWPQPCCEPKDFVSVLRWLCCADGPLNPSLWSLFLSGSYKKADAKESDPMGRPEVVTRFILSYLSNALFKVILLYTLPIYLAATTDPGDFALNAFAVTFIIDLDNEDKAKKYGHVSKRETGNSEQESTAGEPLLQVPAEPCV